jgi:deoxyribose-phosphate aldolase
VLKPETTRDTVARFCEEARRYGFAAVCVNPCWIGFAKDRLAGSPVKVATVIGFPLGANTPATKAFEARDAREAGADELDMVINIGALIERDYATIEREIASVVGVGHASEALVKVILETAYLDDAQKAIAAQIAAAAGADFVKTSTGFGPEGATVEDVRLLRQVVGPTIGVKASGGIRTLDEALAMIEAGATRLGTSSTKAILDELRQRRGEA